MFNVNIAHNSVQFKFNYTLLISTQWRFCIICHRSTHLQRRNENAGWNNRRYRLPLSEALTCLSLNKLVTLFILLHYHNSSCRLIFVTGFRLSDDCYFTIHKVAYRLVIIQINNTRPTQFDNNWSSRKC